MLTKKIFYGVQFMRWAGCGNWSTMFIIDWKSDGIFNEFFWSWCLRRGALGTATFFNFFNVNRFAYILYVFFTVVKNFNFRIKTFGLWGLMGTVGWVI
jgi:hypothetical protein